MRRFFLEPISPLPLAVYRIAFGLLALANAAMLWPDLAQWFGPQGVGSPAITREVLEAPALNLLDPTWVAPFFALHVLAALGLLLGCFTRLSAIAYFLTLASFHHANPLILNSGDHFMRVAAFCLVFAPAGEALSVDRWRRGGEPQPSAPWAQRLIQLQLSALYLTTALAKLHGRHWRDGTAVYYVLHLADYQRFGLGGLADNLAAIHVLTWGTLGVELALATLIWVRPLRPWVLGAGVLFHLGLEWSMTLPLFQWIMLSAYLLFWEPPVGTAQAGLART